MIEQLMMRSERWMYAGGHPNRLAGLLNGAWARAARAGVWRSRLVTLEVTGRASGRVISCPLIVVRVGDERYLVSMLGERASWVRNVRAAGGRAVLRWGTREDVRLEAVPVEERAPIIRRHLDVAPAARSFVMVDRHADVAEFARIAGEIPVFRVLAAPEAALTAPEAARMAPEAARMARTPEAALPAGVGRSDAAARPPSRRRRWLRWIGVAFVAVVALTVAGIGVYVKTSAEPALALPAHAAAPAGGLDGGWTAGAGSAAGFRIEQTVLGMTGDVVGRTNAVTGSMEIAGGAVTAASFRADLTQVIASGKRSPQFDQTLAVATYPDATFTLTEPVAATAAFTSGGILHSTVTGRFTLHGVTRTIPVAISARRDGASVAVQGQIPIRFADWGIPTPAGYGWLGSVADHAVAEFLLVLHR